MSDSESKHIYNMPQSRSRSTSTINITFSWTDVLTIILTIFLKDMVIDLSIFPDSYAKQS